MRLLALDTSSLACTVGVSTDSGIVVRHEEQAREHTRLLLPMVREVLEEAGVELTDLDGLVLGNGPGSFIGMRIGASVAQGLAAGAGLRIAAVSSLAAVAQAVTAADGQTIAVAQDAHMQQVYLGLFAVGDGAVRAISAERLQDCAAISDLAGLDECVAAGYGWQSYPALLAANRKHFATVSDSLYPHAAALLALGAAAFENGDVLAPESLIPAYLRQKVAEIPGKTST